MVTLMSDIFNIHEKRRVDKHESTPVVFSSKAEAVITGMLYANSNLTLSTCQTKAAQIIAVLGEIQWGPRNNE